MVIVIVDVVGNFMVDVFSVFVEGLYSVEVIVIDEVGNSMLVFDNLGVIDIMLFELNFDELMLENNVMLIIFGIINFLVGVIVILMVVDSVGNM